MIDETNTPESRAATGASSTATESDRAGFCQQCGRGLTAESLRRIGNGVFCAYCDQARTTAPGSAGWSRVNAAVPPVGFNPGVNAPSTDEPNPVLAGFLGLIPGVGAMYNAQYAKGVVHLIVFVVLVALADNLNWVLWWFVWGWIFYQAFEAYHTARARRDGLPLPDAFGWNDLGDRLGFPRPNSPAVTPPAATYGPRANAVPGWAPAPPPPSQVSNVPVTPMRDGSVPTSSGVPFAAGGPAVSPPPSGTATQMPYSDTYTGFTAGPGYGFGYGPGSVPGSASGPTSGAAPTPPPVGTPVMVIGNRRFPVGALWLIGLGALFLLGNLLPEWRLSGRWLIPVLLAILALWTATRRAELLRSVGGVPRSRASWAEAFVGPALLLTVAGLLALQDAHVLPLRRSWPVLLVVWGVMLLAQRTSEASLPAPTTSEPQPIASAPAARSSGSGPLGL